MIVACAQRGYDADWLGGTFSRAVFVGNGLVAIVSGLVAHSLVETLSLGPVAPFDAAAVVLIVGGVVVAACWTENYGDSSDKKGFAEQLQNGARAIARGAAPPTSWAWSGRPPLAPNALHIPDRRCMATRRELSNAGRSTSSASSALALVRICGKTCRANFARSCWSYA